MPPPVLSICPSPFWTEYNLVQVIYWFITLWDLADELKPYGVQIESKCCPVLCSVQICAKVVQACALRIWKEFILTRALKTNSIVYKLFHWSVSFNVLLFPRWSRNVSFVKPKLRYLCSVKVIITGSCSNQLIHFLLRSTLRLWSHLHVWLIGGVKVVFRPTLKLSHVLAVCQRWSRHC